MQSNTRSFIFDPASFILQMLKAFRSMALTSTTVRKTHLYKVEEKVITVGFSLKLSELLISHFVALLVHLDYLLTLNSNKVRVVIASVRLYH